LIRVKPFISGFGLQAGDATNWETGEGTFQIAAFARQVAGSNNFNVLWGDQPGEGDFAGGLNGWTTKSITCSDISDTVNALWTWTASGLPGYTFGGGAVAPINSPTLCNGAVIFDSGFLDLGTTGVSGEGACPINQEGSLISPIIDVAQFGVFGCIGHLQPIHATLEGRSSLRGLLSRWW
jgi:hypothetical protein